MPRFEKDRHPVAGGAKTRKCLKCRREFAPDQKGVGPRTDSQQRLCPDCRPEEEAQDLVDEIDTPIGEKLRDGFALGGGE